LAIEAKLLQKVQAAITNDDARVVRAGLSVLRAFCAVEEVRDEIGLTSNCGCQCVNAVAKHVSTPVVCEQGFGLFANLTMRKSPIASKLNDSDCRIVGLAQEVLRQHSGRHDVMRQTVHTLRNIASQDDTASQEIKESDVFENVRKLVKDHEGEPRWHAAIDVSRQFLREYRMDEGMEKRAVYNQFY